MWFAPIIGILSAIVVLIVMWRIDLKKFMGYPATMDATVTVLLAVMLHGTYTGIVAAIIGGLFFSLVITFIRRGYGYKRIERRGVKLVWVEYEGVWLSELKQNIVEKKKLCLKLNSSKVLIVCIGGLFLLGCVL